MVSCNVSENELPATLTSLRLAVLLRSISTDVPPTVPPLIPLTKRTAALAVDPYPATIAGLAAGTGEPPLISCAFTTASATPDLGEINGLVTDMSRETTDQVSNEGFNVLGGGSLTQPTDAEHAWRQSTLTSGQPPHSLRSPPTHISIWRTFVPFESRQRRWSTTLRRRRRRSVQI